MRQKVGDIGDGEDSGGYCCGSGIGGGRGMVIRG